MQAATDAGAGGDDGLCPASPPARPAAPRQGRKRQRTVSAKRWSSTRDRAGRYQAPWAVHAIDERTSGVELLSMKEVLSRCGTIAEAETDTPVASNPVGGEVQPDQNSDSAKGVVSERITEKPSPLLRFAHDSVITPASYACLASSSVPPFSLGPSQIVGDVLRLLSVYDSESDTFAYLENTDEAADTRTRLFRHGTALLERLHSLLADEPALVDVESDAWVFGDVHGNYRDLNFFLAELVPFDITLCCDRLVFLGDYVDRGNYSVECVLRLFALKVAAPETVVLLRGNHEDPAVCGALMYGDQSFLGQCKQHFGESDGLSFFSLACACFARLPVAAVIDKRIFCSHGGFPRVTDPTGADCRTSALRHSQFPRIPSLFSEETAQKAHDPSPEGKLFLRQWTSVYDLLWSDPAVSEMDTSDEHGFMPSERGGIGVSFTSRAVDVFLENNDYDLMIRAHQEKRAGLRLSQSNRVITVFSSSNYQGHGNGAGLVSVRRRGGISLVVKVRPQPLDDEPSAAAAAQEDQED
eukprot:TRINITY_DN2192_c0_g1_i1.p1 TRINITY_DN2192_c0_g1~~TRINITY_DN2192_c0_g1_i1.p1  ORF type:complete len:526 (+),score=51.21 TRINITY_DN2192_c0_g1_i1:99-1676(+)